MANRYYTDSMKSWLDRVVQFVGRRKLTIESQSASQIVATVTREEGTVTQEGDFLDATNLNALENRIDEAFTAVQTDIDNLTPVYPQTVTLYRMVCPAFTLIGNLYFDLPKPFNSIYENAVISSGVVRFYYDGATYDVRVPTNTASRYSTYQSYGMMYQPASGESIPNNKVGVVELREATVTFFNEGGI